MTFLTTAALLLALLGVLTVGSGVRHMRRRRVLAAGSRTLGGGCSLALGALIGALALNLSTYARLTYEAPVAAVTVKPGNSEGAYRLVLHRAGTSRSKAYAIRGDAWRIDARVLRWHSAAALVGLDTRYRLERLGGRFASVAEARAQPPTVYALTRDQGLDLWQTARRVGSWLPLVDAVYGSAAYVPLAAGTRWRVTIGRDGLIIRPQNPAAKATLARW